VKDQGLIFFGWYEMDKCFNCGKPSKKSVSVAHMNYNVCGSSKCKDFLAKLFRENLDE